MRVHMHVHINIINNHYIPKTTHITKQQKFVQFWSLIFFITADLNDNIIVRACVYGCVFVRACASLCFCYKTSYTFPYTHPHIQHTLHTIHTLHTCVAGFVASFQLMPVRARDISSSRFCWMSGRNLGNTAASFVSDSASSSVRPPTPTSHNVWAYLKFVRLINTCAYERLLICGMCYSIHAGVRAWGYGWASSSVKPPAATLRASITLCKGVFHKSVFALVHEDMRARVCACMQLALNINGMTSAIVCLCDYVSVWLCACVLVWVCDCVLACTCECVSVCWNACLPWACLPLNISGMTSAIAVRIKWPYACESIHAHVIASSQNTPAMQKKKK